ncbi:exosome complex component rrp41 [Anaeramoeba flamelloides]|uniref:Exosome complex component rrp41 n=1 Tax=Anaeramoeba flamelloides TaxID=1746091 RepID=A0AAV7YCK7_9EUKA|nr:exosome complex component rrp41 [Anaeramoeba flamelloides]
MEYVNQEGLRIDGRRVNELRKIQCKLGVLKRADGSALFEQGFTRVLVAVYGPREITQRRKKLHDKAIINVEYSVATFSMTRRKKTSKRNKISQEIANSIRKSFETVIQLELFPSSQIDIFIQVLQADGGIIPACINASTLALIDAGVPMTDYLCSCSCSFIDEENLLDLNHLEEDSGGAIVTVTLLPEYNKITLLRVYSARIKMKNFETILKLGQNGCKRIADLMKSAIKEHTINQVNSRGIL